MSTKAIYEKNPTVRGLFVKLAVDEQRTARARRAQQNGKEYIDHRS